MMSELHTGLKMKAALSSIIYRKVLKISQTALNEVSPGQIVNLMANDVARFELFLNPLHYLWIGPVQMFIAAALLYRMVRLLLHRSYEFWHDTASYHAKIRVTF